MTYELQIIRDNVLIHERELSAEQVIDILTAQSDELATAPAVEAKPSKPDAKKKTPNKKGKNRCGKCNEPGHTIRTCPETPAKEPAPKPHPISEEMFDIVKERKEEGDMDSGELSKELGVPLREINVAIFSPNYQSYLERRQRDNVL